MPKLNSNNQEERIKKLEAMILECVTLKPHEKADILDVLPKLTAEGLTRFEKIFQEDAKKSRKLFRRILRADPEFAKKFKKFISEKLNKLTQEVEKEEAKHEEASDLLENL
jgi:hypothetical protein